MDSKEFKPHGFISISNHGGIEVMLNRSGDGVYFRFNYGQDNLDQEEIFEAEIQNLPEEGYEDPQPSFVHGRTIYSLNNVMRYGR